MTKRTTAQILPAWVQPLMGARERSVSRTHEVLWRLGREHGHDTVKALLDAHWSHLRAAREASK